MRLLRLLLLCVFGVAAVALADDATGDLEGRGVWTFAQDGDFVDVTYDWTIRANKPIVEKLSFLKRYAKFADLAA